MSGGQFSRKTHSRPSLTADDCLAWQEFLGTDRSHRSTGPDASELSATDRADWNRWLEGTGETDADLHPPDDEKPLLRSFQPHQPGPGSLTRADFRRLRSGKWDPEAYLDLHGCVRDEADRRLDRFLTTQQRQGSRLVLIIAGKGRRSAEVQGVLNRRVAELLSDGDLARLVTHFEYAHGTHGGTGAYYVILRRQRPA